MFLLFEFIYEFICAYLWKKKYFVSSVYNFLFKVGWNSMFAIFIGVWVS